MTTPDEYRYAKSHIRAALGHLKLAQHYAGGAPFMGNHLVEAMRELASAYTLAHDESGKPFTPPPPPVPYDCPQCGLDPNGDAVHTLTHHTLPPVTADEARVILRGRLPRKGF